MTDLQTQARADAIATARVQLREEYEALRTLANIGYTDAERDHDVRFCWLRIADLTDLLTRLERNP